MTHANWKCILHHNDLQRSSHTITAIGQKVYMFGGELIPRQPRDNKTIVVDLDQTETSINVVNSLDAPTPRVGSATTTLGGKIYMFSGRGGEAMDPIEEQGGLWRFDPVTSTWSFMRPTSASQDTPSARSYHCMTNDAENTVYLHAGCPKSGRLSDLWAFDLAYRQWTRLPDAPGPARGGASIAYSHGCLYRMNGFDGITEQGGSLDVFDTDKKTWTTRNFVADGLVAPEARSVAALVAFNLDNRPTLLTLFGERDPSLLGHAGAGKMLNDFWLYDIASGKWGSGRACNGDLPVARGWFASDLVDGTGVVVAGGLDENNVRLGDIWILGFEELTQAPIPITVN